MTRLPPLLALLALASPLAAQETRASAQAKLDAEFKASDRNGDGLLSRAEVEARIGNMRTGTAKLTRQQVTALAGLWFARTDANRDGKVSRTESRATMAKVFDRYDADGDGKVSRAEQAAAAKAVRGEARR